jgi:acyl-CoA synthetase (NDP forming)/GNAT superfamily N-acetyltransferase
MDDQGRLPAGASAQWVLPRPAPADVLLADGSIAVIRQLEPTDSAGIAQLHLGASDRSLRMRFFTANRAAGTDYVEHLFGDREDIVMALVATVQGEIVATATAERAGSARAEVAFLVSDSAVGRGLGTLLLEHLAAAARDLGIDSFTADVLCENGAMLRVFADAGYVETRTTESGVVSLEMTTASSRGTLTSADEHESVSEARSLAPLLRPKTVAVVGVRRDGTGTGAAVLGSIRRGGFTGRVYVVHPNATGLDGTPTYRRLVDVPDHVDLAVLAVPAARTLDAMTDAVYAGVSSVVVISSGFAEVGPEGAELQRRLLRLARENSIRLVGPNCLGVMANDPETQLNATFARVVPPTGGLAIASQSGGVGIALLDLARQLDLGVRSFVSLGNKADLSSNDLLAAWLHDPGVTAAALYLESFGNAAKFARLATRFAERKPLLAVVGGRSSGGRRAGASHTAAAATPAVGVDALFSQAGVIACRDTHDLARTALLLSEQPLPQGPRVGIVSNAGGLGVLAADDAERVGLAVPELSTALREQIGHGVKGTIGLSNPVDLGAGVTRDDFTAALTPLLESDELDAVVLLMVATVMTDQSALLEALTDLRTLAPRKPVLLVTHGATADTLDDHPGVTLYDSALAALESLAHAATYAAWLRVPRSDDEPVDRARARATSVIGRALVKTDDGGSGWLGLDGVADLLTPYGLSPVGLGAPDLTAAVAAAEAVGYPVAVKVADPEVVHKSDLGLVRVGLTSSQAVAAAVTDFGAVLGTTETPVLVQPMLDGIEVALGLVRDATFGPMVMVATGGVDIDVWDDRVFLLAPVTARDAARAVQTLRIRPLLEGHRGRPAADIRGLERCLVALGRLAVDVPEIAELDLNPVLVGPDHVSVVDAKVRLVQGVVSDAGVPRRLRTS